MSQHSADYQRRTTGLVVASSIVSALALFAVFRSAAEILSVKWIGAWSLIQGLFLIARISDSGAGNNISRFIAVRVKGGTTLDLRNITLASLIIATAPSIILTLVTAPLIGFFITSQFGSELDRESLWALAWLGFLNAVLAATANILLAICEGVFQLNYKSVVVISSNAVSLIALVPLLHFAGAPGLGWVYVVLSATQLVLAAIRVARLVRAEPSFQGKTVAALIRALWRENLHLSGIALIRLCFEPVTKLFLSFFAPLTVIAQFELALRVTTQFRTVVQSALQPLLALGARAQQEAHASLESVFKRNDRALSTLSLGTVVAQILIAPAVQWVGIASHDSIFMLFYSLLAVGNALNTMGLSGYYWQLTSGILSPLTIVQFLMAIANISIGALGLATKSAVIVVASYSAAFAFGGLASRSFLPGISRANRAFSSCLVIVAGTLTSGLILLTRPLSPLSELVLAFCGTTVWAVTLYVTYRAARRRA